ncbi:MAG: alanine racemase [Rhodospirillales bacterium]|nr:alanine racemase [Rhodospirillales bacterium]
MTADRASVLHRPRHRCHRRILANHRARRRAHEHVPQIQPQCRARRSARLRLLLDTPALVLDLDAFELNLRTVHGRAKERGVALRPHAKSHKSAAVGRAQLAAGAIGLCCAKLGEAEALAAAGLDGFLITAPVTSRPKVQRLMGLNARLADLAVVVDDVANVAELAAA